jgi:hypothetical protein
VGDDATRAAIVKAIADVQDAYEGEIAKLRARVSELEAAPLPSRVLSNGVVPHLRGQDEGR